MADRIPPKGHLSISHDVSRVRHGFDVTVHVRSLDVPLGDDEDEAARAAELLAWMGLGRNLEERGVNLYDALTEAPEGESDA